MTLIAVALFFLSAYRFNLGEFHVSAVLLGLAVFVLIGQVFIHERFSPLGKSLAIVFVSSMAFAYAAIGLASYFEIGLA